MDKWCKKHGGADTGVLCNSRIDKIDSKNIVNYNDMSAMIQDFKNFHVPEGQLLYRCKRLKDVIML